VTDADVTHSDPPRSHGAPGAWRSDERFKAQLAAEEALAEPISEELRQALRLQRANPGPLVPYLQQLLDKRNAAELAAREAAVYDPRAIRPDDPYNPSAPGSSMVAALGQHSRAVNKRQRMRPGQRRPHGDDEPECLDGDSIGFRR
jgi:hypothetical protein